jgi:hypothetical protein
MGYAPPVLIIQSEETMPDTVPSFLVIGAMKCATSTICAYLEDHPDVFCAPGCEPNFFSHDEHYAKGMDWYLDFFADARDEKHVGEGSNAYAARAFHPETAERIARCNPDMKIIFLVRDPVERIVSTWIQTRAHSGDAIPPTVDQAVRDMPKVFLQQSMYDYNLAPYREHFPPENIFVGFVEDMKADRVAFFTSLCAFLGVAPMDPRRPHQNASSDKTVPSETYTKINGLPAAALLKRMTPKPLRQRIRKLLETDVSKGQIGLSPAMNASVVETLRPDALAFLERYGKPADFWKSIRA